MISTVLLILALVLFVLAAIPVQVKGINLIGAGLALYVLAQLITRFV